MYYIVLLYSFSLQRKLNSRGKEGAGGCYSQLTIHVCAALNRPLYGFRRHLGLGAVTAKITANVWKILHLSTLITPQLHVNFDYERLRLNQIFLFAYIMSIPSKRHFFLSKSDV